MPRYDHEYTVKSLFERKNNICIYKLMSNAFSVPDMKSKFVLKTITNIKT